MEQPTVSLREFFELQFSLLRAEIAKSEGKLESRLESMNEIRAQLKDQNQTFVTRVEFDNIREKIDQLQRLVYIGLGVGLALQVVLRFLR